MSSLRLLPLLCLALLGCQRDPNDTVHAIESSRAANEFLLDLHDDGARLFAAVEPVPPDSDAPRRIRVRWLDRPNSTPAAWSFDGIPVLDARLIPGSQAAVVITSARQLVLLENRRAMPVHLDSNAHAPLAVSQDGRFLAYARGEIPDLEVVRYDLRRNASSSSSHHMAPAWCPALSPDGSRLVFVSGASGFPELYQLREDDSVVQLTDRKHDPIPFPSGPTAPVWINGSIAFGDADAVHVLALDPPRILHSIPGALPVLADGARSLIVHDPSTHAPRRLTLEGREVAR